MFHRVEGGGVNKLQKLKKHRGLSIWATHEYHFIINLDTFDKYLWH